MCLQFSSELCIQTAAKNEHSPNTVTKLFALPLICGMELHLFYNNGTFSSDLPVQCFIY